ncbi:imidazoleglycerol-phosphate dehydratase HisB [Halobacterium zhouii]|uniref:imidazoleglycerol-phosphate dehydratase HisB n=1 Tax=Halobacterium zhouii TaxID=2902624 RepID=UPI001E4D62DD|nr:imidazoleglycerol-phosphate dehydratase HisB [Halobacterium zhouii]
MTDRSAAVTRETAETDVEVTLAVDGDGDSTVDTGIGFFDHMLESFAKHGLFDVTVRCDGDLDVDDHHTVEDVGIALGQAFAEALGEKRAIERFADRRVPLDEAVASVVLDVSGRPLFEFEGVSGSRATGGSSRAQRSGGAFSQESVGEFTSVMARHFFRTFATHAGLTLHCEVSGENAHHEIEALFKGVARALDDATRIDDRRSDTPSTKGEL